MPSSLPKHLFPVPVPPNTQCPHPVLVFSTPSAWPGSASWPSTPFPAILPKTQHSPGHDPAPQTRQPHPLTPSTSGALSSMSSHTSLSPLCLCLPLRTQIPAPTGTLQLLRWPMRTARPLTSPPCPRKTRVPSPLGAGAAMAGTEPASSSPTTPHPLMAPSGKVRCPPLPAPPGPSLSPLP